MLYDKLKSYNQSGIYPFHMPGHKRIDTTGDGIIPYGIDLTEIYGFDNLHEPSGIIKAIQNNAKKLYSVKNAFMLINGSTGGILAAIRSLTNYGDKVLIARNCHKSVYNAIEICGLNVQYLLPETDSKFGILASVDPLSVQKALSEDENIKVVVITSPTYEGVVSDIKTIAEICHKHNAKLFVDEAHGAHFPFSDIFPNESVSCGADAAVVSLHKTLPSLTQTALLITNDDLLSLKIANNLSVFETSSPSYILMSSIENCLEYLSKNKTAFDNYKTNLNNFISYCENLAKLKVLCFNKKSNKIYDLDKSKVVISTANTDINGAALAEILRKDFKIETEMAYTNYIIAMTSVCDTKKGFDRLKNALSSIDIKCNLINKNTTADNCCMLPEKRFNPSESYKYKSCNLPLNLSMGRVSLEYVWAYPPGIPIIVPGEVICNNVIDQIYFLKQNNVEIYSSNKNLFDCITVTEN